MRQPAALSDGRIAPARLDDAVRRTLWSIFSTGVFDLPVTSTPVAIATSPAHQTLARQVAEQGTVLLKNEGDVLPLKRSGQIAVIGPVGKETVTGVMWSSYVDPGQFVTPIEAIAAAGKGARVVHAQGSQGDYVLPSMSADAGPFAPPVALTAPGGKAGWLAQYFVDEDFSGAALAEEVVRDIDVKGKPKQSMPDKWSAKWSADYTPAVDGLVRLAVSLSGIAKVKVDGQVVIDGLRSTAEGFPGSGPYTYPLQGAVKLTAGRKVRVEVEYSTRGGFTGARVQLGWQPSSQIPAAVALAAKSDVAVVFVNQVTGEEMDRDNYDLPADQNDLVEAVAAVNPNTVVVLNTGGAVKMPWLGKVKGVLQMWYPGSAAGTAIANVLFGDAEPGGRLPISFPMDEKQGVPPYRGGGLARYDEGVMVGYRYLQQHKQQPLFPFGFGLSYTAFKLSDLKLAPAVQGDEAVQVAVRVKNDGQRAGATIIQLYAGQLPGAVATPEKKLVGFSRVVLDRGEEKVVHIQVPRRLLSYWDEKSQRWVSPRGTVTFSVGQSLEHIALQGESALK